MNSAILAACAAEIIKCSLDPVYFIETYFTVNHPVKGHVLLKLNQQQRDALIAIHSGKDSIILASRQVGKTTIVAAYLLWIAMFKPDQNILVASRTLQSSQDIISRIRFAFFMLPEYIRPTAVINNKYELQLGNYSRIIAAPASEKLGRGMAISILYIDEMAFISNAVKQAFLATLSPCFASGTRFIASSTPNGYEIFYSLWEDALNGSGMTAIKMLASEDPDKTEQYFADMKTILSETQYKQEILCEFITTH